MSDLAHEPPVLIKVHVPYINDCFILLIFNDLHIIIFQNSQEDYEQALKHYELALSTFIKFLKGIESSILLFSFISIAHKNHENIEY